MTVKPLIAVLAAALLLGGAAPATAHGDLPPTAATPYDPSRVENTPFGREGDPRKVVRTIRVDMSDAMRFTPASITIRRGQTVRFVVRNGGRLLHEMVLGTPQALRDHAELMKKFPGMEHADPNMAHVAPGATGHIVWQFTQPGEFSFGCLQPGHFEAGMVGTVRVR